MPKRKTPEEKPEEQFKRFVETAKKLDVDEKASEQSFARVAKGKPPAKSANKATR